MKVVIVLCIVVVVAAAVAFAIRAVRSRSARTDWLGELDEIRRASLGDDEEVTGALEAVIVDDADSDDWPDSEPSVEDPEPVEDEDDADADGDADAHTDGTDEDGDADPDGAAAASDDGVIEATRDAASTDVETDVPRPTPKPVVVTGTPTRTVTDAGSLFNEYQWSGSGLVRVETTNPTGLRVVATEVVGDGDDGAARTDFAVDLPRGTLWLRSGPGNPTCAVRTSGAWISASGVFLVVASEDEWTYVMCLEGEGTIQPHGNGRRETLHAGQLGRVRPDSDGCDVIETGIDALESEGAVRRQRRLDGGVGPATDVTQP
ncbi:MAG: hypothetical protein JST73_11730 [Actinobacteria bacterium]|nr:hypothetical protein [Actinomycetota bacterium]